MRSLFLIQQQFTTKILEQDDSLLFSEDIEDKDKLTIAAKYLGISLSDFEEMPFLSSRKDYLRYKYLLLDFELFLAPAPLQNAYRKLADKAYQLIQEALLLTHRETFSAFSRGLSDLYQRTTYQSQPDLSQSLAPIAKKKSGIEPGFEAILHQDLILFLDEEFAGRREELKAYIASHQGDITAVQQSIQASIPRYMIKMDYQSRSSSSSTVHLSSEDVKRTASIKNLSHISRFAGNIAATVVAAAKAASSEQINRDGLLEVLGNDFASMFMLTQEQVIVQALHNNGKLKLLLKSKLLTNISDFGPLVGDNSGLAAYRARSLLVPQGRVCALSDQRIKNAAQIYIPLLFTGDYDKIGSKGQNLLLRPLHVEQRTGETSFELLGIDFGHTFKTQNQVLPSLLPDGRFKQPSNNPFKNFYSLMDAPLSELMKGVLLLVQMAGEEREGQLMGVDEQLLRLYQDEDFYQLITAIRPGEGEKIIGDYIATCENLGTREFQNKAEYEGLCVALKETKVRMLTELHSFIARFKPYLGYSPIAIDLADNLKKLVAAWQRKTSLLSPDGIVGLAHLRIADAGYNKFWQLNLTATGYKLSLPLVSAKEAEQLKIVLDKWCVSAPNLLIKIEDKTILIEFPGNDLQDIAAIFAEHKIKEQFHQDDYQAIQRAEQELKLQDLVIAPWFSEKQLILILITQPENPMAYRLAISANKLQRLESSFLEIAKAIFPELVQSFYDITIDFTVEALSEVYQKLLMVQVQYGEALLIAETEQKVRVLANSLGENLSLKYVGIVDQQITLSLSGKDKEALIAFLDESDFSLIINRSSNPIELYCTSENILLLVEQLKLAPAQIALAQERARQAQVALAQEKKRQVELALAQEKELIVLALEQERHSAVAQLRSYSPGNANFFPTSLPSREEAITIILAHLKAYLSSLKKINAADSWLGYWIVQPLKDAVNRYKFSSSAALIQKLEQDFGLFALSSPLITNDEWLNSIKETLEQRQTYIEELPEYETEKSSLLTLISLIEKFKLQFSPSISASSSNSAP